MVEEPAYKKLYRNKNTHDSYSGAVYSVESQFPPVLTRKTVFL